MRTNVTKAWLVILAVISLTLANQSWALEKVKVGSAIKFTPAYYLPIFAAEEKGFWQKNGLEAEWVPFRNSVAMASAVVAGSLWAGMDTATGQIQAIARGVPTILVADLQRTEGVALYVLPNSPIKKPSDLKGKKIGITRLGSTDHAYARFVARIAGVEGQVRYIGTGGIRQKIGALRAGAIDAFTIFMFPIMRFKVKGEVREILKLDDHRPKEWMAHSIFARRDMVKDHPDNVRKVVNSLLSAARYINQNPAWAQGRMKKQQRYSDEVARLVYKLLRFTSDGKISKKAVENVRDFLLDFEIVPKDKPLPVDKLFTRQFTGR